MNGINQRIQWQLHPLARQPFFSGYHPMMPNTLLEVVRQPDGQWLPLVDGDFLFTVGMSVIAAMMKVQKYVDDSVGMEKAL